MKIWIFTESLGCGDFEAWIARADTREEAVGKFKALKDLIVRGESFIEGALVETKGIQLKLK